MVMYQMFLSRWEDTITHMKWHGGSIFASLWEKWSPIWPGACPTLKEFLRCWRLNRWRICNRPCIRNWSMESISISALNQKAGTPLDTTFGHLVDADIEVLIIAAQDGVTLTWAYRATIMKESVSQTSWEYQAHKRASVTFCQVLISQADVV